MSGPNITQAPPIPMIGYARVSFIGGRDEIISPDIQKDEGRTWAAQHGRRILRWITDLDQTGRNFDRDVMDGIAAIEAGEAAEIGVFKYNRWGRDTLECLLNCKRVERAGGAVVSWTERFDMDTAIGEFSRTLAFAMAQLESQQIGEGWQRAHANRVSRGLPGSGTARFGYVRLGRIPDEDRPHHYRRDPADKLGERYVSDPVTGPVLAALYERYANGEAVHALVYWLNLHGIPTVTGGQWTRYTLRQVLISGFGAGLLRIHDPACRVKPGKGRPKCGRVIYVPGAHKAVISEETWQAFLTRLEHRRGTPPRLRDAAYPFSGLLWCGDNGHRLSIHTTASGVAYRCTRKLEARSCPGAYVRVEVVEERVLGWLAKWAADIEAQAAITQARGRAVARAHSTKEDLAAQEAMLQRKLARLMTRWANDENAEEEAYKLARAPVLTQLEGVRARMREAKRAQVANTGAYLPVVVGLLEEWRTFPAARRRELLSQLIHQIKVYRGTARKPPRIEIIPVWEAVTEP